MIILKKILLVFDNSNKTIHLVSLITISIVTFIFNYHKIDINQNTFDTLITTLGIMTTFFFITVDRINFTKLQNTFTKPKQVFNFRRLKRQPYTQGKLISNTIFSLVLINVILVVSIFLFYLFNIIFGALLISSVVYLMNGFLYVVVLWHLGLDN